MGTVNGGTIISFTPTPSLHAVPSRMPSHHPTGCANFTFQIPSIANAAKKNTNSAERRANHNAVERARRECLNTKFQELAHALPSLAQVRRPSKSIIVQKSLDFIYNARQKDELHDKEMRSIRNENDLLREEINKLREKLGLEPYPPREESKPSTSQQADEAKEDASSKNLNSPEIKIEADNTTTTTNAQESTNSVDIQIKSEECRSDDDISNGNTEEDYDLETSEMMDGKNTNTEINQPIDNQQQQCLYESLLQYPASLLDQSLNQHSYPTSDFNFAMDISPIDHHIVNPNSIHLQFDHPDQLSDDLSAFCEFPLHQKMYPSPPYETAMLEMMPCYSLSPDNSHNM